MSFNFTGRYNCDEDYPTKEFKDIKKVKMFVADFETFNTTEDPLNSPCNKTNIKEWIVEPYLFGYSILQDCDTRKKIEWQKPEELDICILTPHIDDSFNLFLDDIEEYCENYSVKIYFHNADFDVRVLHYLLIKHGVVTDRPTEYSRYNRTKFTWSLEDGGKTTIYKYTGYRNGDKKRKISFEVKCTWRFHRKAVQHCVGAEYAYLAKQEMDYEKYNILKIDVINNAIFVQDYDGKTKIIDFNKEVNYLEGDIVLGYRAICEMFNIRHSVLDILKELGINPTRKHKEDILKANTAPALSKAASDAVLSGKFDYLFRQSIEDELLAEAISNTNQGGLCFFNKEDKYKQVSLSKPIMVSYDINSSYPYEMSKSLPYGPIQENPEGLDNPYTWYIVSMTKCSWKKPYATWSTELVSKEKFMRTRSTYTPNGESTFIFDKKTIQLLNEVTDNDLCVLKTYYQEYGPILRNLITQLFNLRLKYKSTRDARADTIKLIMNSLYGKFCERTYIEDHYMEEIELDGKIGVIKCKKNNEDDIATRSRLTGIYIILSARHHLISRAVKETDAGNVVLYVDTDSIKMIQHNEKSELEKDGLLDDNVLGAWKNEGQFTHFATPHKKKKYWMHNKDLPDGDKNKTKYAISGIKADVIKVIENKASIEDWQRLMWPDHNVIIVNGDTKGRKTTRWVTTVLMPKDVKFQFDHKDLSRDTYYMTVTDGGIQWRLEAGV